MEISVYSCLVALFWFDLVVIVCGCLRMSKRFSYQFGLWPLGIALAAGGLRLTFPVELPMAVVIHSSAILPVIRDVLQHTVVWGNQISFSIASFLLIVWGVGICVSFLLLVVHLWIDYRNIQQLATIPDSRIEALLAEMIGETGVQYRLVISPDLAAPSIGGLFTPVFILPHYISSFSDDEVRYVLRHEWQHFLHHDVWIKLMVEIVICCFWWNLPVYLLRRDLNQFLEVRCDLSIIKTCSSAEQTAYLETILKSIQSPKSGVSFTVISSRLFEANSGYNITQRFQLINGYSRKRNYLVIGGYSVLLAFAWFASLLVIVQPESYPPSSEIMEDMDIFVAGIDDVKGLEGDMHLEQGNDGRYVLYVGGEPWFYYNEEVFSSNKFSQLPIIN